MLGCFFSFTRALTLVFLLGFPAAAQEQGVGWGAIVATPRVSSRLVAEHGIVEPGKAVRVVLDQTVSPLWHTYWKNPGDSGLPIKLKWTLPAGWSAAPIEWPTPQRFDINGIINYGYEGAVRLLTRLNVPATESASEVVNATLEATWLVCKDICIPERVVLPLSLTVGPPGAADPAADKLFRETDRAMPTVGRADVKFVTLGPFNRLDVSMPRSEALRASGSYFFVDNPAVVGAAAKQTVTADETGLHITFASPGPLPDGMIQGVLKIADRDGGTLRRALLVNTKATKPVAIPTVDAPVAATLSAPAADAVAVETVAQSPAFGNTPAVPPASEELALGLLGAAVLALLGGMVLNLMPCVFPILSMKAFALTRHGPGHARRHGIAYAAGVVVCFVGISALLIILRAGGAKIGWGFQLQSPIVVAALALIMFVLGLSMSGVLTIGGSVAGVGSGLANKQGLTGSFFTGVLATVVATPCTAPFMGAAVGFALVHPWPYALTVFACLGLGMGLPLLLLTFYDPLLRRLPKPGVWMERVKHILAFPIYGSAVWLVWVLAIQAGPDAVAAVLGSMVVLTFAAWIHALDLSGGWRRLAQVVVLASVLASLGMLAGPLSAPSPERATTATSIEKGATPYSEAALAELRTAGRPVLINMTAAWCITCLANERTSLSRASVREAMSHKNVAYLKGDWTNQDETISAVLQKHGREGVPLYLLYSPGRTDAQILPQILTESIMLEALRSLPDRS